MEINQEVVQLLREMKIDKDEGLLCLLGYYYNLDVERICSPALIAAISITKIVEKDYNRQLLKWNLPLFTGQETEWDWVEQEYNKMWNVNMNRKDGNKECITRMQDFFKKNPAIRKDDVIRATRAYFSSVKDTQYLKSSAKFIFDGRGADKVSMLLGWVEKTKSKQGPTGLVGNIM